MSYLRFHHVFFALMLLAALSAFVFPAHVSARAQAQLQSVFKPVTKPVYSIGEWFYEKASPRKVQDDGSPDHPRDLKDVYQENVDLKNQIVILKQDLATLQELNADRDKIGDLRSRCMPIGVSGGDAGLSDASRMISGGTRKGLADGMPVICPDGVVGQLTKVGIADSRVQFIWDRGTSVMVNFARINKDDTGHAKMDSVSYPDCVATGQGDGRMLISNQPWEKLKDSVAVNDWVVLDDKERSWRNLVYRVGRVTAVQQTKKDPKFGEILIDSMVDPKRLKEVMVVVR